MKESTYNRTLKLFRSMSHKDRADAMSELLTDYRYDEVGQRVLAHHMTYETLECIDNIRRLLDEKRTAHDGINARMMSLGEIMREAAQRGAA